MAIIKDLQFWLDNLGFDAKIKIDDYSCYDMSTNTIYLNLNEEDSSNKFVEYCKSLGLNRKLVLRILVFLHELGHSQTVWDMNYPRYVIDNFISRILDTQSLTYKGAGIKRSLYQRLKTEKLATKWAIDFINNNSLEIANLETIFKKFLDNNKD